MKKTITNHFIRSIGIISLMMLLIFLLLILQVNDLSAQNRDGSINMAGGEGRKIYLNDEKSSKALGVEGAAFTIEAWVYLEDNNNDNFNFCKFRSGDGRFSLHYRGDSYKSGEAWEVEAKGIGYGERDWRLAYNENGTTGPEMMQRWRHVAFTSNGGSGVKLYIDGVERFSHTLEKSGEGPIASLFPSKGTDGDCMMGGESVNSNSEGKLYMAEVRLWRAQLPASTIAEYYDEEVNNSHPYWRNLIRYYQGHQLNTDGTFEDVSPVDEYDASRSSTDIAVSTAEGKTPGIKPGSFDSNYVSTNFTAGTCQTGDIDIRWDNFQNDAVYRNFTTPRYEVRRKSDNKLIYSGNASDPQGILEDTDVSTGDSEVYTLRTLWYINSVAYYSDDIIETNTGTMKQQYAAPTGFTASDNNCDATIDLNWNALASAPPKWKIERATNTSFSGATTIASLGGTVTSYEDKSINSETTYYYRIIADGTENGCDIISAYSVTESGRTSDAPTPPTNFSISVDQDNGEMDLNWTNPSNSLADGYILIRQKEDGTDRIEININDKNTTSYSDDNIEVCETYEYSIAAFNECFRDGIFSNTTHSALLGQELNDYIVSLTASKGYYSNNIRLDWEINGGLSQVDNFVVERAPVGSIDYQSIGGVFDNVVFLDETAVAGTFYTYRVYAQSTCNGIVSSTNSATDIGFRQPFGVVSGHVQYSGGNAVEGVAVNFERQDGAAVGKSLRFDGDGDYVAIDGFYYQGTDYKELTVETWFKTTSEEDMIIASFDHGEYWRFEINGDYGSPGKLAFAIDKPIYSFESTNKVNDGEWHHVAVVFDNGLLSMYIDGELDKSENIGSSAFGSGLKRYGFVGSGSETTSFNGWSAPEYHFDGNMDEFRIWSVARSKDEIQRDYNRLLSNEQEGLEVYYRFDEGTGSQVFDAAKTGEIFNKNDGTFVGGVNFSDEIPDSDLLGIRGVTDEFGDYTADYIPYIGSGDVFRVIPSFGQHAFEPNSKSLYLGDGASVQNDVNFTDISAFTVSGKVTYENSEVPVEGVAIYIDGIQAIDANNQAVRTDNEGKYSVDVPIGQHYLSAVKEKHTFSEGFFPQLNEFGAIERHEFVEDLTVNFVDDTKITVAGRVVGGRVQAELPLGFDLSLNNVDVSTVEFQLQLENYDLDLTDDNIFDIISVTTDEYSGEYSIELIPEKWIINQAGNDTYFIDPGDISVVDLTNSLDPIVSTNEVDNGDGTTTEETYEYHHDLSFIIQTSPIIEVFDADGEYLHGDDEIVFTNQLTEEKDTLKLGDDNPFLYDVYQMSTDYVANIYVHEIYENPNHPDYAAEGGLTDKVAVKDAEITINDQLMINPVQTEGKTDENGLFAYLFRAGQPNLIQDGTNTYTKTFEVEASVNGLGITWNQGNVYRAYVLGFSPLEGTDFITYGPDQVDIVLRDPPGSNSYAFIEQGSSFSSAETWQMNQATSQGLDIDLYTGLLVQAGGGLVGPVVKNEFINHTEIGVEIDRFMDYDGTFGRRVTFNERIETSSDPEDVGAMADLYIGRSLNAFFQQTKNLKVMPKVYADDNLLTYYGTGEFVLGEIDGFTMDEGDTETYFVYSQKHILGELIPNLILLRGDLLLSSKYASKLDSSHKCYGMSNDSDCLEDFYTPEEIAAEDRSYSYNGPVDEMDSLAFINQQITNWINAIATNEGEKVDAITQTNLSIDGSTGAYSATLKEEYSAEFNWNSARSMNFFWNGAFSNITNGQGTGMNTTMNIDLNFGRGEEHTQERSLEFGYVIDDGDIGDYYSIDIKKQDGIALFDASDFVDDIPSKQEFIDEQLGSFGSAAGVTSGVLYSNTLAIGNGIGTLLAKKAGVANPWVASLQFVGNLALWTYEMIDVAINATSTIDNANGVASKRIAGFSIGSPIFAIRGGQSRCPYEPAEYTNYFKQNDNLVQIGVATLQREVPTITSAPTIVSNVPDTEVATFTLSLGNDSESGTDIWYDLSIDESTNPDGAVILVDGVSAERSFLVPASQTVTKTLTIAPGTTGVLDYEDIGIVLHSTCQANPADLQAIIADTVFVTAKFLPTCTSVEVTNMSDNWIVNYQDGGIVPITLGGYDINSPTLESVSFLYKTLSGTPVTIKKYFVDELSDAYINYTGDKGVLPGGDVSFNWDVSDLVDRQYQIFAKSFCTDGSVTESEYLTGTLDTSTPIAFGTPDPADGIYDAGDDIRIQFSEELEADLVRDNNIILQSVLNGADVSHATSVQFDGIDDQMNINSVSFNGKSFTIEFWAQYEQQTAAGDEILLQHGSGSDLVQIHRNGTAITFTLGTSEFAFDPTTDFTAVTPWDAWHHWAYSYDADEQSVSIYMDDKILGSWTGATFNPAFSGKVTIGNGDFSGRMHELRIWEDVRTYGEVVANMTITLTGNEAGLYGYWTMDEGNGKLAIDQTAGRNAAVDAGWSLEPGGVSWEFTGTNYLSMDSRNITIAGETDLTVEFWFKGGVQTDSVGLFTNGRGDGGDEITDSNSVTSIIADENGLIWVLSGGYAFQGTEQSFFDDEWHHLSFVLDRRTNGKLYIDGSLQNQAAASNFAGLSGAEMALGARIWKDDNNGGISDVQDLYFTGYMDEVRVWNTARSSDLIERYQYSKLEGDEVGLVAYTAFETYQDVQGAYIMEFSLEDLTTGENLTDVNDAISSDGTDHYASQKPPVRDVRGLQDIPFQYVVNGDQIIITPNVDMNRIEGQILEISVKNVLDLNGNRQLSPITWTAFSQQNQITWDEDQIPLEKYIDDALTFTASFTNESGVAYDYELENVPVWLSASTNSGVVNPQETITVTFEVSEALNIGSYEQGINLTTENGFDEKLNVSIRVYGDEPDWSVSEKQFQYSMSVFGRLIIEGEVSRDPYDQVGAFVGTELRGVANLEYVTELDAYEAFINVFSNQASGETITWKAYDASTGRIHENVTPYTISFVANDVQGSVENPVDLEANQEISMNYQLEAGWNWISFNLNDPDLAVVNDLLAGAGSNGDIIKNQSAFDLFDPATGWYGTLTLSGGMNHADMYKLYLAEAAEIQLIGSPIATSTNQINLNAGWNHLGYIPQYKMTLQEALVNMTPTEGDLIKTERQFAMYADALGWVGSLEKLEPGQGYMIYMSNASTLEYPETASLAAARESSEEEVPTLDVVFNHAGNNMSVVAEITNLDALNISENYLLVATARGEIRGYAAAKQLNSQVLHFLTISADPDEELAFSIYDVDNDTYHLLKGRTTYTEDDVIGNIYAPFKLEVLGDQTEEVGNVLVAPNPFNEQISVYMPIAVEGPMMVKLIDLNGRTIVQKRFESVGKGTEIILTEELTQVKRGLYILTLDYDGQIQRMKVTKE